MATYTIKALQKIPAKIDNVWELFSNAANLQKITPEDMGFRILSELHNGPVFTGQLIEYKLKPLFGIPVYWMTEIMQVKEKEYFMDEQRKGPYRLWRHEHFFRPVEGGVEMTDVVTYQNPLGILGQLANMTMVKKKLRRIFEYRYHRIEEIFGKWPGQQPDIRIN